MCNNYANHVPPQDYYDAFAELGFDFEFTGGKPNLEPMDDIRPTDFAPVILPTAKGARLTRMRWGLDAGRPKAAPVINFRSEGRAFGQGRCLVPASAFYEFTGTKYPKTRWRFDKAGADWFCIAGFQRPEDGGRFTMLTCEPGPEVAAIHDRQVVVLERTDWKAWLSGAPAGGLLKPSPAGTFTVREWPRARA